jgi:phosphotransferase system IIA component
VGIDLWVLAIIIVAAMWVGYGIAAMGRKREDEEQMQTAGAEPEQGSFKVRIKQNHQTLAEQIQRLTAARSIHVSQTAVQHAPKPEDAVQHALQPEAAEQHATQPDGTVQHATQPDGTVQHAPQPDGTVQHATHSQGAVQHATHPDGTVQHATHSQGAVQHATLPKGEAQHIQHLQVAAQHTPQSQTATHHAPQSQTATHHAPQSQVAAQHTPQPQPAAQHISMPQTGYNASANWRNVTEASAEPDHKVGKLLEAAANRFTREPHRKRGEPVHTGFCIGSPAQGECKSVQDEYQQGFRIYPRQGGVYAPASGKITRLYPTGNAFRLRTDEGIDLTLKVGTNTEELEGMYFRPRVVQNEVVGKGKLLLEYDLDSIRQEGYDITLWLTVEDHEDYQSIEFAKDGITKIGESLLWITK